MNPQRHIEKNPVLSAALEYREAGLSIIPCNAEKIPALKAWKPYQKELASSEQINSWFRNGNNLAIINGEVSGRLETLDFDYLKAFQKWSQSLLETNPELFSKLVFQKTPRPGIHSAFRCSKISIPGNQKLALSVDKKVLIETRGEGGYILAAPSVGYELERGDFTQLPDISAGEREILFKLARACNQYVEPQKIQKGYQETRGTGDLLPGQDFDQRADIRPYLAEAGWKSRGQDREGRERWARPGKAKGWSATLTPENVFYVFSTNATPFEDQKAYSPFAVYAMLEHKGNFSEAAKELVKKGFGSRAAPQVSEQPKQRAASSASSMADVREYCDLCLTPGQKVSVDEICRGLGAYQLKDRRNVYEYVRRLSGKDGLLKKDPYQHGGYRVIAKPQSLDLSGDVNEDQRKFDVSMPLDLHNLLELKINQVCQVSGRYDAGKSTFLFQVLADN